MSNAQAGVVLQHLQRLAGRQSAAQPPDAQLLERFTTRRDEAAFAALVRRHGPMVLNVCRSVLRHEHDAEDAFQATFLILARRAASLRQPAAVAGWLHEVAHRVAVKARGDAARRRAREQKATAVPPPDPTLDMTLRDLQRVLHEELRRLPEKYRLPLVLCYLEGRSQEQAAGQLGWSKGTLRGRVDRGKKQLRRRLVARGVMPSALLGAAVLAPRAAAEALIDSVVRSAVGGAAASGLPPRILALARGVTRAMFLTKAKITVVGLVALGLLGAIGAWSHQASGARQMLATPERALAPGKPAQAPAVGRSKPLPAHNPDEAVTYSGRVLDANSRPVAGAKLFLTLPWAYIDRPAPSPVYATTTADGRFRFSTAKSKFGNYQAIVLAATAEGHGVAWLEVDKRDKTDDLSLRLTADDAPIAGQVVDLQGRPVAGASVRVLHIKAASTDSLDPWLKAARAKEGRSLALEQKYFTRCLMSPEVPDLPREVVADAAGRFRLAGIGQGRLVTLRLTGPAIATEELHILTRPGRPIRVPRATYLDGETASVTTYYGADFQHVAGPTKPVSGTVRDKDTRQPLPGVVIQGSKLANHPMQGTGFVQTTTDHQGRFRLTGMPKGQGNAIKVLPPGGLPYVTPEVDVPDSPGLDAVTVDVDLKRGVWIEGKITDQVTGKPLPGRVLYRAGDGNLNLGGYLGFHGGLPGAATAKDGTYRIVGLPGPGLILVLQQPSYLLGAERDDDDGLKEAFGYLPQGNFAAFARIDPARGAEAVRRDVVLVPGWSFTGKVVGPDGKPLAGAVMAGQSEPMKVAEFTVRQFNPRRPRPVFFRHPEKGLVGVAAPPAANGGSVVVRMKPGAAVTGRLVRADGTPRAGAELRVSYRPKKEPHWDECALHETIKTDREGRFRIDALLPGLDYFLNADQTEVRFGDGLRLGETKDLGDIRPAAD